MAMRSRCSSLVPPPKVSTCRPRSRLTRRPCSTASGEPSRTLATGPRISSSLPQPLHVELGAEHLDRRGGGRVEVVAVLGVPGHLPVHEPQHLEPGVHPGQVVLHPRLVDEAAGRRPASSPGRSAATSSSARSMIPDEHSVTRSWLSCSMMSGQPWPSPLTHVVVGHPHVLVERVVGVEVAEVLDRHGLEAGRRRSGR